MCSLKEKLIRYARRYIVAEISGTVCAILVSLFVFWFTGDKLVTAVAGAWSEGIGFYGTILLRDIVSTKKNKMPVSIGAHSRNIFLEFGPSEVMDSFLTRPGSMFLFSVLISNLTVATLLGKITADIIFYTVTILLVELREKYLR